MFIKDVLINQRDILLTASLSFPKDIYITIASSWINMNIPSSLKLFRVGTIVFITTLQLLFHIALLPAPAGTKVHAIMAYPLPYTITQADGTSIVIQMHGDEWNHWLATEEGYTILENEDDGIYYYANQNSNGQLVPSDIRADLKPPKGVEKSLRPSKPIE